MIVLEQGRGAPDRARRAEEGALDLGRNSPSTSRSEACHSIRTGAFRAVNWGLRKGGHDCHSIRSACCRHGRGQPHDLVAMPLEARSRIDLGAGARSAARRRRTAGRTSRHARPARRTICPFRDDVPMTGCSIPSSYSAGMPAAARSASNSSSLIGTEFHAATGHRLGSAHRSRMLTSSGPVIS